jgi:hypothetical protein
MSRTISTSILAAPALSVLVMLGCDSKPPEPVKDPAPAPSAQTAADPHAGMGNPADPHAGMGNPANPHAGMGTPGHGGPAAADGAGAIQWTKPAAWEDVKHPSPMRKATYKVTKVEGDPEDAEMSVTQVGGSVDDNIKRWEGQFEEGAAPKTSEQQVGGVKVTVVELSGTFKSGGPMMGGSSEPKKDWMMLSAIAHTEPAHFFKMTGPKKTVESARSDFDALVDSIAKK